MDLNGKNMFQVVLFSILLIIVPMFYFPARFGLDLATGSFTYSVVEIIYYGLVFFILRPGASLMQLLQGAGVTFLYRVMIGTVFGCSLWAFYGMEFSVSLALGVSRYLPSILLHIAVAPFLMRPLVMPPAVSGPASRRRGRSRPTASRSGEANLTAQPFFPSQEPRSASRSGSGTSDSPVSRVSVGPEANGFERAVGYLGEHHAVLLAGVVDHEGLTMACFRRGEIDDELWAAISILFEETNEDVLGRVVAEARLKSLDLTYGTQRLVVARAGWFNLVVVANHEEDELLSIRIKQGAEMIRRYASERYGRLLSAGTEEKYVSDS